MHTIRLRGPWQWKSVDLAVEQTVRLPLETFPLTVPGRFCRKFNRPTGIDEATVYLVISAVVECQPFLNGQPLVVSALEERYAIPQLQPHNLLEIVFDDDVIPDSLELDVWLEIDEHP